MLIEKNLHSYVFIGMIIYIGFVIFLGFYYAKRNKTTDDFFLGNRKLGPWMTALSAEASDMSSWLLMGLPGLAYISGLAYAFYTALGLTIGTYLNWYFISKRLRIYSYEVNSITIPDYFSNRFDDKKKILTFISAIVIFIFFIVYTSSGFAALGKLFESLFGFNYLTMMIIGAIIVVLYTMLGGFLAESASDFIQSLLMIFSLFIVVFVGIRESNGFNNMINTLSYNKDYLSLTYSNGYKLKAIDIISTSAWGLGYFGMPHVLLRFMAIKDPVELKKSRRVAIIWVIISLVLAVIIGLIGYSVLPNYLDNLTSISAKSKSETIFIALTTLIAKNNKMLSLLVGVILSGIIAATMSTSDSQLLITSSVVSQNLLKSIFNKKDEKKLMLISRITIIVIAVIAAYLARERDNSVFSIVSYAWSGFGASFGPIIILSLFWERTNLVGAISGMIGGFASVIIFKHFLSSLGGIFSIYELLPSFIISVLCIIIGSLVSKKPSKEVIDTFNKVKSLAKERNK